FVICRPWSCPRARHRRASVEPSPAPPDGEGWLHEIKHDGHRLIAIVDAGGRLSLVSRNGYDRTEAFGAPFAPLVANPTKVQPTQSRRPQRPAAWRAPRCSLPERFSNS